MIRFIVLSLLMLLAGSRIAQAEIYKHVDADGRVTYSNVKIKGGKKLDLEPADTSFGTTPPSPSKSAQPVRNPSPASFPKVDDQTQNQRDMKRKDILQSELEAEKEALAKAKAAYAEGESSPEVYRTKDGKTFRNVQKYEEKMRTLREEVEAHERNINLLNKEIGANN